MPRPTEFRDPEYERQLAEFKAKKAAALAERARQQTEAKKKVTDQNWVSVNK